MARARLLIADDHELVAEAFRQLLASAYDIAGTVTDGHSLVKAAADLAPDVVLVDVGMPRLNGLDAIERVRSVRPRVRLIVVTQQEDPDTAAEAIRTGAAAIRTAAAGAVARLR